MKVKRQKFGKLGQYKNKNEIYRWQHTIYEYATRSN